MGLLKIAGTKVPPALYRQRRRIRRIGEFNIARDHPSDYSIIALLGGFSGVGGGRFYGTGYYGGGVRPVVIILIILLENLSVAIDSTWKGRFTCVNFWELSSAFF